MTHIKLTTILLILFLSLAGVTAMAGDIILDSTTKVTIVYNKTGPTLDSIAAYLLRKDIASVTGKTPVVLTDLSKATGTVIVIGNVSSPFIKLVTAGNAAFAKSLRGKWECYGLKIVTAPLKNIKKALIIAGSDTRGTAYGVFSISEKIGVSPWYWWADVPVTKKASTVLSVPDFTSAPPSVKYRGIFLNDEDWGLQPWAAKTFEPETGDIGPKTYSKIFELLLRLKANLIWPAMHPSTKAFYSYPGNKQVAADYNIVVGSSHAEPMLRNNVGEWDVKTMGAFNYLTNKDKVFDYWEQRVKESSKFDAIYTMGMRGVHDSGIEGVKTAKEAVPLIERIIEDERGLLKKYVSPKIETVPQAFTAYKEVLEIYDSGLKLPDDITLVWPDDNYGYIQRLNNEQEKARAGGSGIYYHASYWGRPHDYLWISSTNPALIREEMMKAYNNGTDRIWVVNVGDLKPLEYNIQFFMDMAYNAKPFQKSTEVAAHRYQFARKIFGDANAQKISDIWKDYYQLAFERRPEFMGWSQTEPTTQTKYTEYNHFNYGDEAQRRIDAYSDLDNRATSLRKLIPEDKQDAYYELVYYPVKGAALMNKKFLYRDKSHLYAQQNRSSAADYAELATGAYDAIRVETDYYNNHLAGGKWKSIISMAPRNLPVYQAPVLAPVKVAATEAFGVAPEGWVSTAVSGEPSSLPSFQSYSQKRQFTDLYLSGDQPVSWTAVPDRAWIKISRPAGTLNPAPGKRDVRLWVTIDWLKVPAGENANGKITFTGGGKSYAIAIQALRPANAALATFKGSVESNGYLSVLATNFSRTTTGKGNWTVAAALAPGGDALAASWSDDPARPAVVEYDFYTLTGGSPVFNISTLPSLPLNNNYSMRYKVGIDNGPLKEIDFKTVGRTEEWKMNVLRNSAVKQFTSQPLEKGKHTLKIYPIDPGIIFQAITADFGGLKKGYSMIPETTTGK